MKKSILLLGTFALLSTVTFAQKKNETKPSSTSSTATKPAATSTTSTITSAPATSAPAAQAVQAQSAELNPDKFMKFSTEEHNFNTIPEGAPVSYDFEFKNIGKEPIVLSTVQASCGCTTPNWSKEPILPGKTSKITATYNTQGRPGAFTKTITVNSNVGTKVLKIMGTVEKAPDASVPSNDNSMMKH